MPHLSPMNWFFSSLILFSIITTLMTVTWWAPSMKWPLPHSNLTSPSLTLPWL